MVFITKRELLNYAKPMSNSIRFNTLYSYQSSDNTKMSEEFKADKEDLGTKLDAEIKEEKKEDKKEDAPNDEEKKLLDGKYYGCTLEMKLCLQI